MVESSAHSLDSEVNVAACTEESIANNSPKNKATISKKLKVLPRFFFMK